MLIFYPENSRQQHIFVTIRFLGNS